MFRLTILGGTRLHGGLTPCTTTNRHELEGGEAGSPKPNEGDVRSGTRPDYGTFELIEGNH